ncbi:MAG: hypothetical protein AAB036_05370 [Elusimicrobiota bacterium]
MSKSEQHGPAGVPPDEWLAAAKSLRPEFPDDAMRGYRRRLGRLIQSVPRGAEETVPWVHYKMGSGNMVWIPTGCAWFDETGGCVVCDGYGKNPLFSRDPGALDKAIDEALAFWAEDARKALAAGVKHYQIIMTSATVFDDHMFPAASRVKMFKGISKILRAYLDERPGATTYYHFESRLSDYNEGAFAEIRRCIPRPTQLCSSVGIEASSPFVRNVIINKGTSDDIMARLKAVVEMGAREDVGIQGNALLGIPFLTELESMASVVETTMDILDAGCIMAGLMTSNLKKASYIGRYLNEIGHFNPPSIHATVAVMRLLLDRGYGNILPLGFTKTSLVKRFAAGCERCTDKIAHAIDSYLIGVTSEGIPTAEERFRRSDLDCACRQSWLQSITASREPLSDRFESELAEVERKISRLLGGGLETKNPG